MPDNEQTRAMVRDELINREVLYQEAQKTGVGKKPEVPGAARHGAPGSGGAAPMCATGCAPTRSTDADVQKEYDRAKSQTGDKEYRARHILVETEDQAKA
jgi:peptidyl-prolyl cis-trans isomerase C